MNPPSPLVRLAAAGVFVPALALWTWKLVEPNPVPEAVARGLTSISDLLPFLMAKSLHAGGYAFLTVLAWLAVPPRWRALAVVALLLHGVGSEIAQTFVPNRSGRVADVLIDGIGVALGALWARWALRRLAPPQPPHVPPKTV